MLLAGLQAHIRILINACRRRKEGRWEGGSERGKEGGRKGEGEKEGRLAQEIGFYYLILTTE